ncbi:hypothetical protein Avbf_10933, partial [Armadillidium vulgare]
ISFSLFGSLIKVCEYLLPLYAAFIQVNENKAFYYLTLLRHDLVYILANDVSVQKVANSSVAEFLVNCVRKVENTKNFHDIHFSLNCFCMWKPFGYWLIA